MYLGAFRQARVTCRLATEEAESRVFRVTWKRPLSAACFFLLPLEQDLRFFCARARVEAVGFWTRFVEVRGPMMQLLLLLLLFPFLFSRLHAAYLHSS